MQILSDSQTTDNHRHTTQEANITPKPAVSPANISRSSAPHYREVPIWSSIMHARVCGTCTDYITPMRISLCINIDYIIRHSYWEQCARLCSTSPRESRSCLHLVNDFVYIRDSSILGMLRGMTQQLKRVQREIDTSACAVRNHRRGVCNPLAQTPWGRQNVSRRVHDHFKLFCDHFSVLFLGGIMGLLWKFTRTT